MQRESICGYTDPSVLVGTFLEEVHGHGITLALFGAVMCVSVGALPKHAQVMATYLLGVGAMLAKVFGSNRQWMDSKTKNNKNSKNTIHNKAHDNQDCTPVFHFSLQNAPPSQFPPIFHAKA